MFKQYANKAPKRKLINFEKVALTCATLIKNWNAKKSPETAANPVKVNRSNFLISMKKSFSSQKPLTNIYEFRIPWAYRDLQNAAV